MKRAWLLLALLPASLCAKPRPSPERQILDKNVELAGGYSKFERLETLTYAVEDAVHTSSGPVTRTARRALRMHDGGGFRLWEKKDDGTVTVVLSSAPETAAGRELLADAFWLFAPQRIREAGSPLEVLSAGFFLGRLLERLAVRGEPLFPGGEDLVFYLDKSEGRIIGASYGSGPTHVSFREPLTANSLLVVPGARFYFDKDKKRTRTVKISNVVVNSYLDEDLFAPGATP